jgi:cyanophycin synthetase
MGQPGDLVLIFADQLTRSWKQITKFKPAAAAARTPARETRSAPPEGRGEDGHYVPGFGGDGAGRAQEAGPSGPSLEGLIRDERGVRFAPEADD